MNELLYIKRLKSMNEEEIVREEEEIYEDCVYFNDCSQCPHKFEICEPFDWEMYECKLDVITMIRKSGKEEGNNECTHHKKKDE